jgi:peptide subunit release factor RF-3
MKSALQQLIDKWTAENEAAKHPLIGKALAINDAQEMLKTEREQIEQAFGDGVDEGELDGGRVLYGDDYYNQTFGE